MRMPVNWPACFDGGEMVMDGDDVKDGELDDEELKETILAALRAPRRGDLEEILASNLAAAVFAQPIEKIRMIFEAFLLLPEEEQSLIVDDEGEIEKIRQLYEVAISLSNTIVEGHTGTVPWSFSITEADRYLCHFINRIWQFWNTEEWQLFFEEVRHADLRSEEGRRIWNAYLRELARFLCSGFAPLSLINQVQSEYIVKVMPYASHILREIFKRYITKETWETMLSIVGGRGRAKAGGQP